MVMRLLRGCLLNKFISDIIKRLIPTTKALNITTEDYVVEGIVNDEFDLQSLQNKYQVFKVVSVDDNRKGGLQHYKIGVSE